MVRLDSCLLLLHQFRQLKKFRGHQTDDEQLHVIDLRSRYVVPPEPATYVPALVTPVDQSERPGPNVATETRKWTFCLKLLSEIFEMLLL